MANVEIRIRLAATGIKQYEVAAELGLAEGTLSRKLRFELPDEERTQILAAIDRLSAKKRPASGTDTDSGTEKTPTVKPASK